MLLKFFRKKKNMKRIIWGLAILIIPAFVIWGAGANRGDKKGPSYAGRVFGRKISLDEYFNMWQVTRDYAVKIFGNNVPPEFIDQMAWSRILLLEKAKKERIAVNDTEVVEMIASYPAFQRNSGFDKKLYKSMVGDNARGFEERIRDDILISKLREKVTKNISVSDDEIKDEYRKKFEKIKSSYVSIPFSDFEKDVGYERSDLARFYGENKSLFQKPEEINTRYIEVPFSKFDKEVYISEEQVKRYFEEHLSDYKNPDSEDMPQLNEEIKKEINDKLSLQRKTSLAEELSYRALDTVIEKKNLEEAGRTFALEIKETGFFNMQEEVPGIGWSYEFTRRAFELKPGEISHMLIKTAGGFCIIQLKEKKPPYIPAFEEAEDGVKKEYVQNKSVGLCEKEAKKLCSTIKNRLNNGVSFEDIAKDMGRELKTTELLTRESYIPGLGPAGDLVENAISLKNNEIADPVKMAESWVILKLDEYQDVDEDKFTEEKDKFRENLLSRKKEERFNNYFEVLKKEADFISYTVE